MGFLPSVIVFPEKDGWGGNALRLRASRLLVISDEVARSRRVANGEPGSFISGLTEIVEMVPLWTADV